MLSVQHLSLDYAGVVALTDVQLKVEQGEAVALVGANGAGKSSLLAAVAGLHRPVQGSIKFLGQEISNWPAHRIAPLGLALVPEGRRLFGHLTVRQNLILGAYHQRDSAQRERDLAYVTDLLPHVAERIDFKAASLSGGEQQMVALGRALMGRPKLLMLDEPSLGIAPLVVARIFEALHKIRSAGTTVLLVEQNLKLALEFADRACVLQTGRVVLSGKADDMLNSDDVRKAYLGL